MRGCPACATRRAAGRARRAGRRRGPWSGRGRGSWRDGPATRSGRGRGVEPGRGGADAGQRGQPEREGLAGAGRGGQDGVPAGPGGVGRRRPGGSRGARRRAPGTRAPGRRRPTRASRPACPARAGRCRTWVSRSARRPPASKTSSSSPVPTTRSSSHRAPASGRIGAGRIGGMAPRIDLNCDLGEERRPVGAGRRRPGHAAARRRDQRERRLRVPRRATRASWRRSAGRPRSAAWPIGAHVSYLDREHFGRRVLDVPPDVLRAQVALPARARCRRSRAAVGATVAYVKPHGALYNTVVHDEGHARAVVEAVDLPVRRAAGVGGAGARASSAGLRTVPEAFADRGYRADGTLVPRSEAGALVTDADEVAARVVRIADEGRGDAPSTAPTSRCAAESVCVHSDTPGARRARAVRPARAGGVRRRGPALRDGMSVTRRRDRHRRASDDASA